MARKVYRLWATQRRSNGYGDPYSRNMPKQMVLMREFDVQETARAELNSLRQQFPKRKFELQETWDETPRHYRNHKSRKFLDAD